MQLFKKGQAESAATGDAGSAYKGKTGSWFSNNKRSIAAVALIVVVALFMRTVFAYAISAGSDFALSGGVIASEHLRNITAMITSGSFFGIDVWMFAPDGSVNVHPPLVDMFVAGIGWIIQAVTGCNAETAAAAALGGTSAVVGSLACVPMYYLGKEVFNGKKRAGFLAALFLAFCPVIIANTVFSNGTEIAFVLFFVICMLYFIVKGVKAIDNDHTLKMDLKSMFAANGTAMRYALYASIFSIVIAYSWNGFRSLLVVMLLIMICVMIVNRLKVVDARPLVMFFSTIIALTVIVAAPYYCICGLWDLVFSGVVYAMVIGLAVCISFALLQSKPWVYTIPAYAVAAAAVFVALFFAVPDVFNVIVNGNSVYAQEIQQTIGSTQLSLSTVATYFGWLTMWCGVFVVIYMVFKFPKNSNNPMYLVSLFALVIGMIYGVKSTTLAVVYSPLFAIGFAACVLWLFDTVDFSEYFKSFRGCNYKTIWKKIVSPKPFIAILCVLLLVAAPNMMTAIDSSISNNEKAEWNADTEDLFKKAFVGSLGYSVLTDEDYKINYTLKQYGSSDEFRGQTVLTWYDYSADLVTYGHFKSVTDTRGNNAVAAAHILLGDETKGEATAAMIVYSMQHMGLKAAAEWLFSQNRISEPVKDRIVELSGNISAYRDYVLKQQNAYGQIQSNVSDENVVYLFLKKYLTAGHGAGVDVLSLINPDTHGTNADKEFTGYSSWNLSQTHSLIADHTNTKIDKVMATVNMIPIQVGDGSVFGDMAKVAGYASIHQSTSYGTFDYVPEFYSINASSLSYTYTAAMYNSLLYKVVGGKTSEEASQSFDSSVFESVYGLSNFSPDYKHFYVKYSDKTDATADDMRVVTYDVANKEKATKGGVISYFGYPIFANVVDYTSSDRISGTVDRVVAANGQENVKDVRVELWGADGHKLATAYTDKNGYYEVPFTAGSTIKFYAGAANTATTGGSLVYSKQIAADEHSVSYQIQKTTFSGYVDFKDKDITNMLVPDGALPNNVKVVITGANTKEVYETDGVASGNRITFTFDQYLMIDTYSITVKTADGTSLGTGSYTLSQGENNGFSIAGTICKETITVLDESSIPVEDADVTLTNEKSGLTVTFQKTNKLGKTSALSDGKTAYLAPGTYKVTVNKNGEMLVTTSTITVSSSASNHNVSICKETVKISITTNGFNGDSIYVSNGAFNGLAMRVSENKYDITLPLSTLSNDKAYYTAYAYQESDKKVFVHAFTVDGSTTDIAMPDGVSAVKVSGKITKAADKEVASPGIVYFKNGNVTLAAEAVKFANTDDYVYTMYLPTGLEWNTCTTDGSAFVHYEKIKFEGTDDIKDRNFKMDKGYKASGKFYWGTSEYFRYVNMHVTEMEGIDSFDITTDAASNYSLMVPEGKTCKVTTPSLEGTSYNFTTGQEKQVPQNYTFNKDQNNHNFYAYANNSQGKYGDAKYNYVVINKTSYDFYIGSTLVEKTDSSKEGQTANVYKSASTLSHPYITITLKYILIGSSHYYVTLNVPITVSQTTDEQCAVYEIKNDSIGDNITEYAEKYQEVKVNYTGEKAPTVSITNIRSGDLVEVAGTTTIQKPFADLMIKDGTNEVKADQKYIQRFVSYNTENGKVTDHGKDFGLADPYLVKITRTVDIGDGKTEDRIFYSTVLGNEDVMFDVESGIMKKSVAYTGTTGSTYSGNVIFKWNDGRDHVMNTTISAGTYSVNLPAESTFDAQAKVTNKVNENTMVYTSAVEHYTTVNADSAKLNLVVSTEHQTVYANSDPSVTLEINDNGMKIDENHKATVEFTATLDNATASKTYLLSGGSAWASIKFYEDSAHTKEIKSVTTTGTSVTVHCIGIFNVNYQIDDRTTSTATASFESPNLTVIFSEANGTVTARGQFGTSESSKWVSTTLPLEFGIGSNQYGQGQTVFSVKVINPNNTPVRFKLTFLTDAEKGEGDNVVFAVHSDKQIYTVKPTSPEVEIWVPGASTTEIHVEKIYKDGSTTGSILERTLTFVEDEQQTYELKPIKDATGVEISGDKHTATVKIQINTDGKIDVKEHDASGRGVFNTLGSAPASIMVLGALVLLAVIAMLWLGFRRGVFARKK